MDYIYLIKYNGTYIAAAKNDKCAKAVIREYLKNNKDMNKKLFKKEAIRYFNKEKINEI